MGARTFGVFSVAAVLAGLAGFAGAADGTVQAPAAAGPAFAAGRAVFAAEAGGVRIEAPAVAGLAPTLFLLADGEAIEVGTRVRFAHAARRERGFAMAAGRPVPGALDGPGAGAVRFAEAIEGADLVHEARPGALKTALVIKRAPGGLAPGAPGAVFFEEELRLPRGWGVEGLSAAAAAGRLPGLEAGLPPAGFSRIDQHLHLVDGAGALRARIEAPRVFETAPGGAEAVAFAEVAFDAASGVLLYRTAAPAAWLADPARRFPVAFDPALGANTPLVIGSGNTYAIAPQAGRWNVVAVSAASPADFDIAVSGAASGRPDPDCDYLIADGHQGAIAQTSVYVDRYGLSGGSATLQHATPGSIRLGLDAGFPWSSADVVQLFEIDAPVAGVYDLVVEGLAGMKWSVYNPGGSSAWTGRGFSVAGFGAGATRQSIAFGGGPHALVIWRDGGAGVSGTVTVRWPGTPSLALAQDAPQVASNAPAARFSLAPRAGGWNAVGVFADDWDLSIGAATSARAGASADFCVADGRRGAIAPVAGYAVQARGSASAALEHSAQPAGAPALVPGVAATRPWGAGDVLRLFEVEVAAPGGTWLTVSGVTGVSCALFAPGTSAGWASRASAAREVPGGTPASVSFPAAGTWALVVFREGASAPSAGTLSIDWSAPRPVPSLVAISPASATEGTPGLALTVDGSGFDPASVVRVNGADRPTAFVSATRLTAQLPASDLAAAGTLAITVFTPAPGGGTSGAQALLVQAAAGGGSGGTGGGTGTGGTGGTGTGTGSGSGTGSGGSTGGSSTGGGVGGGTPPSFGPSGGGLRTGSGGGGGCALGAPGGGANAAGALAPWAAILLGLVLARARVRGPLQFIRSGRSAISRRAGSFGGARCRPPARRRTPTSRVLPSTGAGISPSGALGTRL